MTTDADFKNQTATREAMDALAADGDFSPLSDLVVSGRFDPRLLDLSDTTTAWRIAEAEIRAQAAAFHEDYRSPLPAEIAPDWTTGPKWMDAARRCAAHALHFHGVRLDPGLPARRK